MRSISSWLLPRSYEIFKSVHAQQSAMSPPSSSQDDTKLQEANVERHNDANKLRQDILKRLLHIPHSSNVDATHDIRIENCIGFTQVPVGLAGPLKINGHAQKSTVFAPLATTEGALIASCSRGAKAFHLCGGVSAITLSEGISRAPVFRFGTVDQAVAFHQRAPELFEQLRRDAESTTKHGKLLRVTPHVIGTSVHLKFDMASGDAAGQNMVTIATDVACRRLMGSDKAKEMGIKGWQLDGQMSSDKKASWGHVQSPRGVEVLAWGTLTNVVVEKVLKSSAKRMADGIIDTVQAGIRNGQLGSNINTVNVVAAMFIACGQDAASVLESGWMHMTAEYHEKEDSVTLCLYIPSLPVGTVGGGTNYPTQREALEILGCAGVGKKRALAETVAAFALCLDVSTIAAMLTDTFAQSHARLGRRAKL